MSPICTGTGIEMPRKLEDRRKPTGYYARDYVAECLDEINIIWACFGDLVKADTAAEKLNLVIRGNESIRILHTTLCDLQNVMKNR